MESRRVQAIPSSLRLFLDLDGVLADFDAGVLALTGRAPEAQKPGAMWGAIARAPEFFARLAFAADGEALWAFCRPFAPTILTGLPLGDWAEPQKRRWVQAMLGDDVPVIACMACDKHRWSGAGHVLVDDRDRARGPWLQAGVTFVHHVDAARSIAALRRLGFGGDAPEGTMPPRPD